MDKEKIKRYAKIQDEKKSLEQRIADIKEMEKIERHKKRKEDDQRKIILGSIMLKLGLEGLHYNFWLGLIAQAWASIESFDEIMEVFDLGNTIAEDMGTEQFSKIEQEINLNKVIINMNEYDKKSLLRKAYDLTGYPFKESGVSKEKALFPEDFFDKLR